jgi:hypothetical protein
MLSYSNNDTGYNVSNNTFTAFGHGVALFGSTGSCTEPCLVMDSNHFTETNVWDTAENYYHQSSLHVFGTAGVSVYGVYYSNNLLDGDWGTHPTGLVFVEGGTDGGHVKSSAWWNNVFDLSGSSALENTNGWFGLSADGGTHLVVNNTMLGQGAVDNSLGMGGASATELIYKNNVITGVGNPMSVTIGTTFTAGNNLYGPPSCQNYGNCFTWNGSFTGSFTAWKTASGGDATSVQSDTPLLSASGVPQVGSPAIDLGANLTSLATGLLASLASDTTAGGTRTGTARPAVGAWWSGAYAASGTLPTAPTNVRIR